MCVPSQVLGVNPIEGFDKIKQTYGRKLKDAQRSGDEATAALVGYLSLFLWSPVRDDFCLCLVNMSCVYLLIAGESTTMELS